jgi:hypothetical protein
MTPTAQGIATGLGVLHSAVPDVFDTLMRASRRDVGTMVIFPARNDSWIVGAAGRRF